MGGGMHRYEAAAIQRASPAYSQSIRDIRHGVEPLKKFCAERLDSAALDVLKYSSVARCHTIFFQHKIEARGPEE